jgi:nuclear pore complex protein Nup53
MLQPSQGMGYAPVGSSPYMTDTGGAQREQYGSSVGGGGGGDFRGFASPGGVQQQALGAFDGTPTAQQQQPRRRRASRGRGNDLPPPTASLLDENTPAVATPQSERVRPTNDEASSRLLSGLRGERNSSSSNGLSSNGGALSETLNLTPLPVPASANDVLHGDHFETWVTVFGFPPSAISDVLRRFQGFGEVVDHRASGNWLHVRYATRLQAEKALCQNGALINNGMIMVGVRRCNAQTLSQLQSANNRDVRGVSSGPADAERRNRSRGLAGTQRAYQQNARRQHMAAADDADIMQTPRKREGVCPRLMKFLFGSTGGQPSSFR